MCVSACAHVSQRSPSQKVDILVYVWRLCVRCRKIYLKYHIILFLVISQLPILFSRCRKRMNLYIYVHIIYIVMSRSKFTRIIKIHSVKVHNFSPYFPKIHSNIILPSTHKSSKRSLSFSFQAETLYAFLVCLTRATCPSHLIFLALITPTIFGEWYNLWSYSLCRNFPLPEEKK
jgi:hypothetical protein